MGFIAPVAGALAGGGLSTALTLVGAVVSGIGARRQANAQAEMAQYQAAIAERNAQIAANNAETQRDVGAIDQQEMDFQAAAIIADEKNRQAASGFSLNSTAYRRRDAALRTLARRDALRVREDAERKAISLENEQQGELSSARASRAAARNYRSQGRFAFASSLISGATQVANIRADQITRSAGAVSRPYS
jgi:hypothetical protein